MKYLCLAVFLVGCHSLNKYPASPALQYGKLIGAPMRCWTDYGPNAKWWNARDDGYCYPEDFKLATSKEKS